MKKIKKLIVIALATTMLLGMSLTALASNREYVSSSSNCNALYCRKHTCALYKVYEPGGDWHYECADGHNLSLQ